MIMKGSETIRLMLRDKHCIVGGGLIAITFVVVLLGPIFTAPPNAVNLAIGFQPPSTNHFFGTDPLGRDELSRVLNGSVVTLFIAVSATVIALAVALPLASFTSYYGGVFGTLTMRVMDILLSFPSILISLILVAILGNGLLNIIFAVGLRGIPVFAVLIKNCVLSIKEEKLVLGARAVGETKPSILRRYILPELLPVVVTQTSMFLAMSVLMAAGLGFLGFGVAPPTSELGIMISDSKNYIGVAPWLALFPGLAIMIITLGFNLFGDGLNTVLNPKLRARI